MPLPFEVEKLEDVPEAQRALYVEKTAGHFVLDVAGLEGDPRGFKSAMEKERTDRKKAEDRAKALEDKYAGIDADEARKLLTRTKTDDELQQIAEGKTTLDQIVEKRMDKARQDYEKKVADANALAEKEKQRAMRMQNNALDGEITKAATEAGVHKGALRGALLEAKADGFVLDDESGNVVMLVDGGDIKRGKDGKNPFSLKDWFEERKADRAHWWLVGNGGGGSSGGGRRSLTAPDYSKMTPAQKLTAARREQAARGK